MKGLSLLYAFLGGALVGASAAILFAPEKGSDLRSRIKEMLKKNGIDFSDDEVEQLVKQISAQIEDWQNISPWQAVSHELTLPVMWLVMKWDERDRL